jgi:D-xylose transport system substrate-binding protein
MDQTAEGWDPQNAMNIVENALTAVDNDIDAILSPNDGLAGGAIQALAAQGLAGKVPVSGGDAGLDAAKRIVQGTQAMTVYRDIKSLAEKGIEIAIRLAEGKDITDIATSTIDNGYKDVPLVSGDATIVTVENID